MSKKICFRCKKGISDSSNYFSFIEFDSGKIVKIDYAHKKCWNEFLSQVTNVTEAMGLVKKIKNKLTESGFLPPEEVVIE